MSRPHGLLSGVRRTVCIPRMAGVLAALSFVLIAGSGPARAAYLAVPGGISDNDAAPGICTPACADSGGWSGWWQSTSDTGYCECGPHDESGAAAASDQPSDQSEAPPQPQPETQPQTEAAPVAAQSQPLPEGGTTQADRQDILDRTNQYRARYCVGELGWSSSLEQSAQKWADHLAESCDFNLEHSGSGENLYVAGRTGADKAPGTEAVDDWYDEVNNYDFAAGNSKNGETTGHFTQLVWAGTRQVGCGVAICRDSQGYTETTWVCQYDPPGNMSGAYTQNVPQQCQ